MVPGDHLLRRIADALDLSWLRGKMKAHYSHLGRPSVCPELMVRMLIVGYCHSIRSERRLCREVKVNLVCRWFCGLGLEDKVPHHSAFSVNRLGRFRETYILRKVFEEVVCGCMTAGLVGGEGFAVDASVIEANASRFQRVEGAECAAGPAPPRRQTCSKPRLDLLAAKSPVTVHLVSRRGASRPSRAHNRGVLIITLELECIRKIYRPNSSLVVERHACRKRSFVRPSVTHP
jgi:transposase